MKTFIIDGLKFNDLNSFFLEALRILAPGFSSGAGWDAFNDFLVGGLSKEGIDYREPAEIIWKNSSTSQEKLSKDFDEIVSMIKSHGHTLELK